MKLVFTIRLWLRELVPPPVGMDNIGPVPKFSEDEDCIETPLPATPILEHEF